MLKFYKTYTTPFQEEIPVSLTEYFDKVSKYKRFRRFISRYLYSKIFLNKKYKINHISPKHKNILWLQWTDPYLGDSLMDLSSRILLKDKTIDLLTKNNVANIYQGDNFFNQIFTNLDKVKHNTYDLIIIDSYRARSIKVVAKYFNNTPFVSLYGYYSVYDFNRLYFSFFRINQLLSKKYTKEYIYKIAKPSLPIKHIDKIHKLPKDFIAIAIGGATNDRTYNRWPEVVESILANNISNNIVLVGSKNGESLATIIKDTHSNYVMNLTNKVSFNETASIIKYAKILLCADGGLLHVANATQTPVISLFYIVNPYNRFININKSYGFLDKININNINPQVIINKIQKYEST